MADYQLWLGDCLEEMDRIEDGSIDAIICDLPFQITACKWDKMIPFEPLWKHYKRVIKRNGAIVLFGSNPFNYLLWASNPQWFKYEWVWNKGRGNNFIMSKIQPMRSHEFIMVFSDKATIYNPQMRELPIKNVRTTTRKLTKSEVYGVTKVPYTKNPYLGFPLTSLDFKPLRSNDRVHPTQKPVALLEYLIKTYTNEGDLILDNTCGSGSTLEAAMRCNRRSIGIEKDAHYFNVASQRLERVAAELCGELNHLPMFAEAAS